MLVLELLEQDGRLGAKGLGQLARESLLELEPASVLLLAVDLVLMLDVEVLGLELSTPCFIRSTRNRYQVPLLEPLPIERFLSTQGS